MPVHVFEKVREDMGVLPGNTRVGTLERPKIIKKMCKF